MGLECPGIVPASLGVCNFNQLLAWVIWTILFLALWRVWCIVCHSMCLSVQACTCLRVRVRMCMRVCVYSYVHVCIYAQRGGESPGGNNMLDFASCQLISCILISRVKKYCCYLSQTGVSARGLLLFKCLAIYVCSLCPCHGPHPQHPQQWWEWVLSSSGVKPNLLCTVLQPSQSHFAIHMLELMTGAEPFLLGSNNERREAL